MGSCSGKRSLKKIRAKISLWKRSIELRPSPDASIILPDITASFLSDGSVRVNVRGTISPGAPPQDFLLGVDLEKGTYTTRPFVERELPSSGGDADLSDRSAKAATSASTPSSSSSWNRNNSALAATVPDIQALAPSSSKWARIRAETTDPINLKLAETHLELSWEIMGGTVDWNWVRGLCIGYRTVLTTDWFVDYCYPNGYPYFVGPSKVCQESYAGYHNYDFPCFSINAPTYIDHWMKLCGRSDGYGQYDFAWYPSGECASLLWTRLIIG